MLVRWAILFAFVFTSFNLTAGPRVELLQPLFNGSGCPLGSVEVILAAGAKKIDIKFEDFYVMADNVLGRVGAQKECDATIQIKVPHGFSVAVSKIKYSGIQHLPFGSNAHFVGSHFFNHEPMLVINKRYYGRSDNAFDISSHLPQQSLFWSPCGEDVAISSRTSISVSSVKSLYPAHVQVDDIQPGLSYHLLWRTCAEQSLR